jgi:hypothetical protein
MQECEHLCILLCRKEEKIASSVSFSMYTLEALCVCVCLSLSLCFQKIPKRKKEPQEGEEEDRKRNLEDLEILHDWKNTISK